MATQVLWGPSLTVPSGCRTTAAQVCPHRPCLQEPAGWGSWAAVPMDPSDRVLRGLPPLIHPAGMCPPCMCDTCVCLVIPEAAASWDHPTDGGVGEPPACRAGVLQEWMNEKPQGKQFEGKPSGLRCPPQESIVTPVEQSILGKWILFPSFSFVCVWIFTYSFIANGAFLCCLMRKEDIQLWKDRHLTSWEEKLSFPQSLGQVRNLINRENQKRGSRLTLGADPTLALKGNIIRGNGLEDTDAEAASWAPGCPEPAALVRVVEEGPARCGFCASVAIWHLS